MKRYLVKMAVISFIFVLTAEKSFSFFGFGKKSKEKKKIGVTIYKYDDNFMALMRQQIEAVAGGKNVELMMNDSQNDQSKQNDQVDIMLAKGVDVLAINLVDPAAARTIITKAKKEGVPVVFFNKEPSQDDMKSYDKAYYVGTNSAESGVIQGEVISKHWKQNSNWDRNNDGVMQYVLLKGEPGHPDAEARTTYSVKTIEENGIKTEKLHLDTAMWDTAQAKDKTEAWLSGPKGDDIEVIIANNDGMALGAIEALKANNRTEIVVFGVDALAEALVKIQNGEMAGTVLNDAKNQGIAVVDLAVNLANGENPIKDTNWVLDEFKTVRVPYVAVDIDNYTEFK